MSECSIAILSVFVGLSIGFGLGFAVYDSVYRLRDYIATKKAEKVTEYMKVLNEDCKLRS